MPGRPHGNAAAAWRDSSRSSSSAAAGRSRIAGRPPRSWQVRPLRCVSGWSAYVVSAEPYSGTALLWGAVVLAAFAGLGLTAALLVPVTRFTPLIRMVAEWLELVAIVAAPPLAAWIGGLFTWVRVR